MNQPRNNAFEGYDGKIPDLFEISNRFTDLNTVIPVEVLFNGYMKELKAMCPFKGMATVKVIVNILNRGISVIMGDSNLIKLRNSIIYYNEYFCPSKENIDGYRPALTAFTILEEKYNSLSGRQEIIHNINNPFLINVLDGIADNFDHNRDEVDDALAKYMRERSEQRQRLNSLKSFNKQPVQKEKIIPQYIVFSQNINDSICLDYEKCYDNIDFIDEL